MASPKDYLDQARDPVTSAGRLVELAEAQWEFVRAAVADHPNTPPAVLARLMPSGVRPIDESIAVAIGRRPDAPADTLRSLAKRFDQVVDWSGRTIGFELGLALLANPSTPMEVVLALLDPARTTTHFRSKAASSGSRSDVLSRLRDDVSEKVRKRATAALLQQTLNSKQTSPASTIE